MRRRTLLAGAGLSLIAACSSDRDDAEPQPSPERGSDTNTPNKSTPSESGPLVRTIATGLNVPWAIRFLPDGAALVSQRDAARIARVTPEGSVTALGEVPDVTPSQGAGEGGLLGIAIDPDDASVLYAYHSTDSDNRVVRIDISGDRIGANTPILTGIPVNTYHNGGGLVFGPDGMLYVSTGDAGDSSRAPDTEDLGGKILRIRRNGDPADGNPFDNPVWSFGHRNVEGIAFDRQGRLWASEFGDAEFDELNLIERGDNYGWPAVEGTGGGDDYVDPVHTWPPSRCSPAGVAVAAAPKGTNAPAMAYMAALRGERLIGIPLNGASAGRPREWFTGRYGRIRAVEPAPDGSLWVSTSNTDGRSEPGKNDDRLLRVALPRPRR